MEKPWIHCENPECSNESYVPEDYLGKTVRCRRCRWKFKVSGSNASFPARAADATVLADAQVPPYAVAEGISPPPSFEIHEGPSPVPEPIPGMAGQIGRFQIRTRLGMGAFGTVYQAYDPQLERDVALKVPRAAMLDSPHRVERFLGDAKAAARLRHPHIVPVFDAGRDGDCYYIASAYIPGQTLREALDDKQLNLRHAVTLVRQLAEALAYAHDMGIVHRDVKPANIMLDKNAQPHLIDFGLAHRVEPAANEQAGKASQARQVGPVGTPAYMPPEQAGGQSGTPLPASDQYSLGVVLYEILCGRTPFDPAPVEIVCFNVLRMEPPAPRERNPAVPVHLDRICRKAMAKKPEERFQNCWAVADELRRWLDGEPSKTWPPRPVERVVRWCRREPVLAGTLGVAVAALLAVLVLSICYGISEAWSARRIREEQAQTEIALKKSRERLAEQFLDRGQALCRQGEVGIGLLWMERSLDVAREVQAGALEKIIRMNLAAWRRQLHPLRATLAYPGETIAAACFSPDGHPILTWSTEGKARLWDASTGRLLGSPVLVSRGQGKVQAAAFGPDGRKVLTGHDTGWVCLWDLQKRRLVWRDAGHDGKAVRSVAFSPDGHWIVTGGEDRTARLWNLRRKEEVRCFECRGEVQAVAFSPTGQCVLTGSTDGMARLWRTSNGSEVRCFDAGHGPVHAVAFSPDNCTILTGHGQHLQGEAVLWSVAAAKPLKTFRHQAEVYAVAFSRDGKTFLTGGQDRAAKLWDGQSLRPLGRTLWHRKDVLALAFSPNGRTVLTLNRDQGACLWEVVRDNSAGPEIDLRITAGGHTPSGKTLVIAGVRFDRKALEAAGLRSFWKKGGLARYVKCEAHLLQPDRAETLALDLAPSDRITVGAVAQEGNAVVLVPKGGSTFLVRREWGEKLSAYDSPHASAISAAALRPDGQAIVFGYEDGHVCFWKIGAQTASFLRGHAAKVLAVAFSPDGQTVLTGSRDGTARLWDLAGGKEIRRFDHPDAVLAAAFRRDGQTVLTGYAGGAQLWKVKTGKKLGPPLQHLAGVLAVALSPSGDLLLTGGTDNAAQLWDAASSKPIGPPLRHPGIVIAVAFHPGGQAFRTVSAGTVRGPGTVRLWQMPARVHGQEKRLDLWAQVVTGIELKKDGVFQVLTGQDWQKRRRDLGKLGGPPALEKDLEQSWRLATHAEPQQPPQPAPDPLPDNGVQKPVLPDRIKNPPRETDPKPRPEKDDVLWARSARYLPADSAVILSLNVRQALASELLQDLDFAPVRQLFEKNDQLKLLPAFGLDPLKDFARLTLAGPAAKRPEEFLLIAQTRLPGKFQISAEAANKVKEIEVISQDRHKIWKISLPKLDQALRIAVADTGTILASLSANPVRLALDRAAARKPPPLQKDMTALLEKVGTSHSLFGIAQASALMPVPNEKIEHITLLLTAGKDLQLHVEISAKSAEAADEFRIFLNFALQRVRELEPLKEIARDVIEAMQIEAKDKIVTIKGRVQAGQFKKMWMVLQK
jgi:WD40 repeat protein